MKWGAPRELLSVEEMYRADALAIASGTSGTTLMNTAGRAVADAVVQSASPGQVVVLCGPGNNGGDGLIAALALAELNEQLVGRPWEIRVCLLGEVSALKGDAKWAAEQWLARDDATIETASCGALEGADVVVDAMFGAGLARPLGGVAADIVSKVNNLDQCTVISVDVPSGVLGDSGTEHKVSIIADKTVTFFRLKPGHFLFPGRRNCGEIQCVDIGIDEEHLTTIDCQTFVNTPDLWGRHFPITAIDGHKYNKGHALVVSGGMGKSGAARLAALAAIRSGAGLVTVGGPIAAIPELSNQLTTVMVAEIDQPDTLRQLLDDPRKNAVVVGPGNGVSGVTRDYVQAALSASCSAVLDADALSSFEGQTGALFPNLSEKTILTPHEGEFRRLFPGILEEGSDRLTAARKGAAVSGSTIVLKGPDTIIASPDGRAAINFNAPPSLATAGSGDVLSGIVGGFLAQSMPAWEAACAGVWCHGATASRLGPALIAEDLINALGDVLSPLISCQ